MGWALSLQSRSRGQRPEAARAGVSAAGAQSAAVVEDTPARAVSRSQGATKIDDVLPTGEPLTCPEESSNAKEGVHTQCRETGNQ